MHQHDNRSVPTRWYTSQKAASGSGGAGTPTAGNCIIYPVEFYGSGTVKSLGGYKQNTTNRTGLKYRHALYTCGTDGLPDTLVADSGDISWATASVGILSADVTGAVTKGTYWIMTKCESAGTSGTQPTKLVVGSGLWPQVNPRGYVGTQVTDFGGSLVAGSVSTGPALNINSLGAGAFPSDASGETYGLSSPTILPTPFYKYTANPDDAAGWAWHGADPRWQVVGG